MAQPVLFLDVDGVLDPFGDPKGPDVGFRDFKSWTFAHPFESGLGYKLWLSPEMGKRVGALDVELRWLTSWREHANRHIGQRFGWPFIQPPAAKFSMETDEMKLWNIETFLEEEPDRPFIWVDDDMRFYRPTGWKVDVATWLRETATVPYLLSEVDGRVGLTPELLDEIETFIASLGVDSGNG